MECDKYQLMIFNPKTTYYKAFDKLVFCDSWSYCLKSEVITLITHLKPLLTKTLQTLPY